MGMKAAIYCRLSEEDKKKQFENEDSESIQNQKSMLSDYALSQGWEIYRIYSDDDYTGADRKRPEFIRLLEDAENRRFDIVLCKTQSRFTRELELVEKYIHGLFPVWGIRFVSVVDNADTSNKGNKKSRQINGLVNEWYLEDMSENIRSVLTNKRQNGLHIGSFALYGYKKDPVQKGRLLIDPEAAVIVRKVFTLFSQGYGKTAIARILNAQGIPNPTEYKRLHGLRYRQPETKNGTLWKYSAIADMLQNEMYIGNMVQGKYGSVSYKTKQNKPRSQNTWYRVEGTHEPIIDQELWDRVQNLLQERTKPFSSGKTGIFAGKARCACCGYVMRSSKSRGRYYLQCSTRHAAKDACIGAFISVEKLEQAVLAQLKLLSEEYLDMDNLEKQISFSVNRKEQRQNLETSISRYERKIAEYTRGLKELYLDKVKGVISEEEYLSYSKDFSQSRKQLENMVSDNRQALTQLEKESQSGYSRRQLIKQYINPDRLSREMVEKFIIYIAVGKRLPGTDSIPVEIHWDF